ncbi:hypothetical protein [Nostoc sp. MS1]|nr:hypothetical protein [Nostoc sp. MS1]
MPNPNSAIALDSVMTKRDMTWICRIFYQGLPIRNSEAGSTS